MNVQSPNVAASQDMQQLRQLIAQLTENGESEDTAIPALSLYSMEHPTEPSTGMYKPSLCLVAQGAKQVILGGEKMLYDENNYLLTSLHLPSAYSIHTASPEKPYLGIRLLLDMKEVAQMMADSELPPPREQHTQLGMTTSQTTAPLLNAVVRLVQLLQNEVDIPIMAPIIKKEITYRLLTSDQGIRLRQIASLGSQSNQVSKAIIWLKDHFSHQINIDELAQAVGMSKSTFHQHFRIMTNHSPLQYQKQLRLQEARRLMLVEHKDAATAAFEVGYESPSQFSREYSRQYGAPPLRDITSLRQLAAS